MQKVPMVFKFIANMITSSFYFITFFNLRGNQVLHFVFNMLPASFSLDFMAMNDEHFKNGDGL